MQRTKYAPEFKDEAVKQVIDKGHSVVDVAKRLSTIVFDATSISISSAPMSSSGSVKLRYEICLEVWGNAKTRNQMHTLTSLFNVYA